MNSSSRQITILALALPLAFLLSIAGASGAPPSTPSLCQTSDYPALCARIARPLSSVTPETLANASLNAAATKAMQARATAARLVYSVHDPAMRQALSVCRTAYSDALDSLRIAGGAIKSHGKGDVMINLSAAVHNVASCEDNFKMQVQGAAFPLRRVNTSLMRLVQELKETMKGAGMPWPGDEGELRWEQAWMAIKKVWASKWNERAYFSTRKVKLDHDYLCMAVLIQEVVSADYAFVIHTANPSTGDPSEIYAEVVKGLGETLVGAYPGRALSFVCRKNDLDSPKLLGYPSKPVGLFIRRSIIFRSDSNGEDLEGYAGAGLMTVFQWTRKKNWFLIIPL